MLRYIEIERCKKLGLPVTHENANEYRIAESEISNNWTLGRVNIDDYDQLYMTEKENHDFIVLDKEEEDYEIIESDKGSASKSN